MSKQKQKKLGYKEYENLLSQAHQKIEILANKVHELQTYLIGYVEYRGQNIMFNDWMNKKIKEIVVAKIKPRKRGNNEQQNK